MIRSEAYCVINKFCSLECQQPEPQNNNKYERNPRNVDIYKRETPNIYPPELTLKRELVNQIPNCPTWIFQLVYLVVNMLLRSIYDKTDAFNLTKLTPYNKNKLCLVIFPQTLHMVYISHNSS